MLLEHAAVVYLGDYNASNRPEIGYSKGISLLLSNTFMKTRTIERRNILRSSPASICAVAVLLFTLLILPTISIAQGPCGGHGKKVNVTNTGNEFLLVFDQNELPDYIDGNYQDIFIATLDQGANVTVTCKHYPSFTRTFNMTARSSMSFRISDVIDPLMNSDEVVDNTVIHVVSDSSIVCYGMNHKLYTTDAFLALPKNTASTDYRVMSYYNSALNTTGNERESEFSVAAFADNTHVTITPSAQTLGGKAAGTPLSFTLNSGEGVQIQANPPTVLLDLTGSHVTSDQPVVVYGAHVRAEVPVGYQQEMNTTSRNALTEAIPPISAWGDAFVCTNFGPRTSGDLMRIQALNDGTIVKLNGTPRITLNHDQWYDSLILGPIAVETSGPALAGMLAHTSTTLQGTGDPFLAVEPPINQSYNDFTFFTSNDPFFTINGVVIVTEQSGVGKIVMDGTTIPAASFSPVATQLGGLNWSVATVSAAQGAHHITSPNDEAHGFTILAYGFGRVDGYGYTAGSLLKPLRGVFLKPGDNPGIVQSTAKQNVVNIRNILANRVYLDSTQVILDGDAAKLYNARVRENLAMDVSHMEMGEDLSVHIDVTPPLEMPVMATVKCFTHTALWFDLEAGVTRIKLMPASSASVASATQPLSKFSTAYPNPFRSGTTISFSMPQRADVSLKVYDDLGRLVSTLLDQEVAAGPYDIHFEKAELPVGHYIYELKSNALNINERQSIVLAK